MGVFTSKLKQVFRTVCNNKVIPKVKTKTELSESKTIMEERQRCIEEFFLAKFCMENLVDKMVARLKAIHEYVHDLLFQTDNLVFLFVLNPRRRKFLLEQPERNIEAILNASDGDKLFKWTEDCRKEMPIDCNFILCKGTLSNFTGSKGCVGELSVVNSDSEDYDVIRFKAEPILNSRPYDDGTDEIYSHALWFKLTQLKYKILVYLTLTTIKSIILMIDFELGLRDLDEENKNIMSMLTYLCKINENHSYLMPLSYEEWTVACHEELTISEYSAAVKRLGYRNSNFKLTLDLWSKFSFEAMRTRLNDAMMSDICYIDFLEPYEKLYNKYLQMVKKGQVPKEGVWTFGPIICRLSKTMNRTARDYR